jgi:hypothetical protein
MMFARATNKKNLADCSASPRPMSSPGSTYAEAARCRPRRATLAHGATARPPWPRRRGLPPSRPVGERGRSGRRVGRIVDGLGAGDRRTVRAQTLVNTGRWTVWTVWTVSSPPFRKPECCCGVETVARHGYTSAVFTRARTAALMCWGRPGQAATTRPRSGGVCASGGCVCASWRRAAPGAERAGASGSKPLELRRLSSEGG